MIAYVIFSNDSLEGVVLDDAEKARICMSKLFCKDYAKQRSAIMTRTIYRAIANWHIHEIEVL